MALGFEVVERSADQVKANQQVQAKAAKVLALLKNSKIDDKDVVAIDLRSEPEFGQGDSYSQKRSKLVGYVVTRPFEVKIRDVAEFPKLVDQLIAIGDVQFSSIGGSVSKENQLQDDLWDKALVNARQRAEKTLKAANMKIDSMFAVSPVSFPEISGSIFSNPEAERVVVTGSMMPTGGRESQYILAPIKISRTVHVIYLISPVGR